jgi:hypothetical protein
MLRGKEQSTAQNTAPYRDYPFKDVSRKPNLTAPVYQDTRSESWREYVFGPNHDVIIYRINKPRRLYVGKTTHRVVDADGITHCVPAPGYHGCVIRWFAKPEVSF